MEKRGNDALEQAANMMVAVSYLSSKQTFSLLSVISSLITFPLFNARHYGGGLGSPRLLKDL